MSDAEKVSNAFYEMFEAEYSYSHDGAASPEMSEFKQRIIELEKE